MFHWGRSRASSVPALSSNQHLSPFHTNLSITVEEGEVRWVIRKVDLRKGLGGSRRTVQTSWLVIALTLSQARYQKTTLHHLEALTPTIMKCFEKLVGSHAITRLLAVQNSTQPLPIELADPLRTPCLQSSINVWVPWSSGTPLRPPTEVRLQTDRARTSTVQPQLDPGFSDRSHSEGQSGLPHLRYARSEHRFSTGQLCYTGYTLEFRDRVEQRRVDGLLINIINRKEFLIDFRKRKMDHRGQSVRAMQWAGVETADLRNIESLTLSHAVPHYEM